MSQAPNHPVVMDPQGAPPARYGIRTCLLVALVLISVTYLVLRGAGAYLIVGDRIKKVDAVVVLGGGSDDRIHEAARLMDEKYAGWLVLTEPGELEPGGGLASEHYRQLAIEEGISPNAILITEHTVLSTYDEGIAVRHLMEKQNFTGVIVVTDPFHTQRTRMIFRDIFRGSGLTMRVQPVRGHWYRSDTWFLGLEGWGHTLREYAKLLAYRAGLDQRRD